jgi:hypothetical protein
LGATKTWNFEFSNIGTLFISRLNQTRNASWTDRSDGDKIPILSWTNNAVSGSGKNNDGVGDYTTVRATWNDGYNTTTLATDTTVYVEP